MLSIIILVLGLKLTRSIINGRGTADETETLKIRHHCSSLKKELNIETKHKALSRNSWSHWWQNHWEPTWSCPLEERVQYKGEDSKETSGDGGKWVCDVPYISKDKNCLVYSIGSSGDYAFELGIRELLGCEIHVFDPINLGYPPNETVTNIYAHDWGLALEDAIITNHTMKSLLTMITDLGHLNKTINILKIDIEGLEFGIVNNDIFWDTLTNNRVEINQLLIELHFQGINGKTFKWVDKSNPSPRISGHDMDLMLRNIIRRGFVMFHKEVNLIGRPPNDACEFSFIKKQIDCSKYFNMTSNSK